MGLGLYFVRETIERQHGGRVKIRSKAGKGARVVVRLPIAGKEGLNELTQDTPGR